MKLECSSHIQILKAEGTTPTFNAT